VNGIVAVRRVRVFRRAVVVAGVRVGMCFTRTVVVAGVWVGSLTCCRSFGFGVAAEAKADG
jgi:hypothetical protein